MTERVVDLGRRQFRSFLEAPCQGGEEVAELFAFGDDFSSNSLTHPNEAELEFQSKPHIAP